MVAVAVAVVLVDTCLVLECQTSVRSLIDRWSDERTQSPTVRSQSRRHDDYLLRDRLEMAWGYRDRNDGAGRMEETEEVLEDVVQWMEDVRLV